MKNVIIAAVIASAFVFEPALAGNLSDPALDQETIANAAVEDSSVKIDALMLALLYIVFLAAAGGAF